MPDGADRTRSRRSPLHCCTTGCGSAALVALLIFAIGFAMTGHYQVKVPPHKSPPPVNGFDDYVAAGRLLKQNGGTKAIYPGGRFSVSLVGEEEVVAGNQQALALVKTGLTKQCMPHSERSWNAKYDYLADSRELARLLMADADVKAAKGDHAGAFESGIDCIQMGQDVARGGPVIHALVSNAIQAIGQGPMLPAIDHLSQADCARLSARLQKVLLSRQPYADTIDEERWMTLENLANLRDPQLLTTSTGQDDSGIVANAKTFGNSFGWHFLRDQTLKDLEIYYDQMLVELKKPRPQRKKVPLPKSPYASWLVPVFENAEIQFASTDARNRIMLCALTIRGYELANGKRPATLGELGLHSTMIADPFGSGELVYHSDGEDYLLYSVGPNGKDDGGVPADRADLQTSGDVGIRMFMKPWPGTQVNRFYRLVPHMRPPIVKPGDPPLSN